MTGTEAVDGASAAGKAPETAQEALGRVSEKRHRRKTIKSQPPNNKQLNVILSVTAEWPLQKYIIPLGDIY